MDRLNGCKQAVECGEKSGLDIFRGHGDVSKGQMAGGARIAGQHAGEAEVGRRPGGGVDAHVRHHAGNDQPGNMVFLQMAEKRGVPETVGKVFPEDGFSRAGSHAFVNLNSGCAGEEKRGSGACGDVLNVKNRESFFTEGLKQVSGLFGCGQAARQLHCAAGKIVVLDVNQQQGLFHGECSSRVEGSVLRFQRFGEMNGLCLNGLTADRGRTDRQRPTTCRFP